jgi:hypothetical protein
MSDVDIDMSDVDMLYEDTSDVDANFPSTTTPNSQQDLIDTIAELEHRLQRALSSIESYQSERSELLGTIIQLRLRLQNVVDILEK